MLNDQQGTLQQGLLVWQRHHQAGSGHNRLSEKEGFLGGMKARFGLPLSTPRCRPLNGTQLSKMILGIIQGAFFILAEGSESFGVDLVQNPVDFLFYASPLGDVHGKFIADLGLGG